MAFSPITSSSHKYGSSCALTTVEAIMEQSPISTKRNFMGFSKKTSPLVAGSMTNHYKF
jgi:hypothetical protein